MFIHTYIVHRFTDPLSELDQILNSSKTNAETKYKVKLDCKQANVSAVTNTTGHKFIETQARQAKASKQGKQAKVTLSFITITVQ
jgi:hypothetical protein